MIMTMMKSGNILKFKHLSQFKTKEEFNQHINSFLQDHSGDFTKGELEAFRVLVQYSIKYKGVSNARIGVFTKTSHENNNGYGFSRSTFERMVKKAVKLGILTIHKTIKVTKGGNGHNVYVFNRYEVQDIQEEVKEKKKITKLDKIRMLAIALKKGNDEPFKRKLKYAVSGQLNQRQEVPNPCESRDEQPQEKQEAIISKAIISKELNKRIDVLDHTFTGDYVPNEFRNLVKCFFDDAKTIEEYWRMVKFDTYKLTKYIDEDTILHTAIHSFKQMIGKLKKGKVKNPIAYFKGVVHKKIDEVYNELPLEAFN